MKHRPLRAWVWRPLAAYPGTPTLSGAHSASWTKANSGPGLWKSRRGYKRHNYSQFPPTRILTLGARNWRTMENPVSDFLRRARDRIKLHRLLRK